MDGRIAWFPSVMQASAVDTGYPIVNKLDRLCVLISSADQLGRQTSVKQRTVAVSASY